MKKTSNNTITDLLSRMEMIMARKRTKNNMQSILNSKNNITKWDYFWIGLDVLLH